MTNQQALELAFEAVKTINCKETNCNCPFSSDTAGGSCFKSCLVIAALRYDTLPYMSEYEWQVDED